MRYLLTVLLFFCSACAAQVRGPVVPDSATLAVAGFVHPRYDWELMAGVLPGEPAAMTPEILASLDESLAAALRADGQAFMPADVVRRCEEIILAERERHRFETVDYWQAVGKCMSADYMLVPFMLRWQEREGGEWGVSRPAAIVMDLYLIEVASGQVRRFHYDEEQRGLAENLLSGRQFLKRKARWVTAGDIAEEGMDAGLKELGL